MQRIYKKCEFENVFSNFSDEFLLLHYLLTVGLDVVITLSPYCGLDVCEREGHASSQLLGDVSWVDTHKKLHQGVWQGLASGRKSSGILFGEGQVEDLGATRRERERERGKQIMIKKAYSFALFLRHVTLPHPAINSHVRQHCSWFWLSWENLAGVEALSKRNSAADIFFCIFRCT